MPKFRKDKVNDFFIIDFFSKLSLEKAELLLCAYKRDWEEMIVKGVKISPDWEDTIEIFMQVKKLIFDTLWLPDDKNNENNNYTTAKEFVAKYMKGDKKATNVSILIFYLKRDINFKKIK